MKHLQLAPRQPINPAMAGDVEYLGWVDACRMEAGGDLTEWGICVGLNNPWTEFPGPLEPDWRWRSSCSFNNPLGSNRRSYCGRFDSTYR